jgi:hypothetical protein
LGKYLLLFKDFIHFSRDKSEKKDTLLHLEHVKIKWFARIHSSQFLVCKSETQLITRSEAIDLIEPETGK